MSPLTRNQTGARLLLSRLDRYHIVGPQHWLAPCPAHNDLRLSLAVKETHDGTVMLRCWEGCCASDITEAAGLELADLFPAFKLKESA